MENVFNLIAKFKMQGKTYLIILVNKTKILFLNYNNGKINTEFSQEEYNIFQKIYESLLIDKKTSINICEKYVNGTLYKIWYDMNTKNYFWKSENNESYNNEEDNILLNFRYNHVPEEMYNIMDSRTEKNENRRFYDKFVRIGKNIISIAIVANIALSNLSGVTLATKQYNNIDKPRATATSASNRLLDQEKRKYNYEEIRQAIKSNINLKNDEKEFLYKLKFVFDENNKYMNLDLIIERLKTLKIIYNPKPNDDKGGSTIKGKYSSSKNEITLYGVKQFEGCNLPVFTHELFHAFQSEPSTRYTKELSNEFFIRETLRRMREEGLIEKKYFCDLTDTFFDYGDGYVTHMFLYYGLAEMMTEEELRNYQFSCDETIIVNALSRIDKGSKSVLKAYKFLNALDELREYNNKKNVHIPKQETEKEERVCLDIINEFYHKEKGTTIEEDLNVIINCNSYSDAIKKAVAKTLVNNLDSSEKNESSTPTLGNTTVLPKTYLSTTHEEPYIVFYLPKREELSINSNMCEQYKSFYRSIRENSNEER